MGCFEICFLFCFGSNNSHLVDLSNAYICQLNKLEIILVNFCDLIYCQ